MATQSRTMLITPWIVHVVIKHWLPSALDPMDLSPSVPHMKILLGMVAMVQRTTKATRLKQTQ